MQYTNTSVRLIRSSITAITLFLLGSAASNADTFLFQEGNLVYNGGTATTSYTTAGVSLGNPGTGNSTTNLNSNNRIMVGQNGGSGIYQGLLGFDLSALEAVVGTNSNSFTINSVTLTLTIQGQSTGALTSTYYANLLGDGTSTYAFSETTATWANTPLTAGGTIGTTLSTLSFNAGTVAVNSQQTWASTSAFTTAVSNALAGDNVLRIDLTSANEGVASNLDLARFYSDENGTVSFNPSLLINYTVVPEPSSIALMMVGGFALLTLRRKSRMIG